MATKPVPHQNPRGERIALALAKEIADHGVGDSPVAWAALEALRR